MLNDSFQAFITRHRFRLRDITNSRNGKINPDDLSLIKYFPESEKFFWFTGSEPYTQLKCAFLLAEHMAENSTDQTEAFALVVSKLTDEAWKFALDFAPFHKTQVALSNLDTVFNAMVEAATRLNAALAGMTSAVDFRGFSTEQYERERSVATSNLLNFSALYASYIDVCYRIRDKLGLANKEVYSRAINRLVGSNLGEHSFIKNLRNFILHNELVEPECILHHKFGEERTAKLVLNSSHLLRRGSKWNSQARQFIQRDESIDLIATVNLIVKDVARLIKFHQKLAEKNLSQDKMAYEYYVYERRRFKHLQASASDIGAVFKRPTSLMSRLIKKDILELVINSSLSNDEVHTTLTMIANRYQNLNSHTLDNLSKELSKILSKRPIHPKANAYLNGREI
ncbi:hypothetical protein [Thalassospira xiamenensis]|uniref:hypothetical protein n=1 Tax=Thalassospira xiamenensis TaxID=220697 RepID=UPI003AA96C4D